jgi:carbon-monoxide dehydrogenase large subunit
VQQAGFVVPKFGIESLGLKNLSNVHWNLSVPALYEEAMYDAEGQNLASSFLDYPLPSAREMPRVEMFHLTTPSPINPLGVKGAGEAGTVGSLSAGVNAIVDALSVLGIRHIDTPCTPYRVWQAIANAGARGM